LYQGEPHSGAAIARKEMGTHGESRRADMGYGIEG
jgi:hypothetical protein